MSGQGAPPAFVSVVTLQSGWRTLTAAEQTYARQLLDSAGTTIRDEWRKAFGTEIADDHPTAVTISIEMVRTCITTGAYIGHLQYGRLEGPRQKTGTLVNPGGALVFTDYHRKQLGIPIIAGPQFCFDGGF
ncbi:head-to-tail connector complex protein [Gordonia phage Kiko]|nr:head-to-tail connector complex protein [Gordonia phage Kiko]